MKTDACGLGKYLDRIIDDSPELSYRDVSPKLTLGNCGFPFQIELPPYFPHIRGGEGLHPRRAGV
jgi:hypothetical protein